MTGDKKQPDRQKKPGRRDRKDNSAAKRGSGHAGGRPVERIARRLARAGVASRREAEAMIEAGRVSVNGRVLKSPALNVGDSDTILVDGKPIPERERTRLFLFHKPAGTMTTNRDPEGRRTVFDSLPQGLPRLMTVGRLDYSTEGLLLMTNDGGLARVLELPTTGWLRRYRARVHGPVDQAALDRLRDGMAIDGVLYGAIEATLERRQGANAWLAVALREGKNREIKKVFGALGLEVTRLIRVSYGPFQLGELPAGEIVEVRGRMLRDQLGPRLIEQAGADFDARIMKPFDKRPARSDSREEPRGKVAPNRHVGRKKQRRSPESDGPDMPRRSRASNVWMAPGARPTVAKRSDDDADRPGEHRKDRKTGRKRRGGDAHRRR